MLHLLRTSSATYEVGLAADLRRRPSMARFDARWLNALARSLCREEAHVRTVATLVEQTTERALSGEALRERFVALVAAGRIVLRECSGHEDYPLPDPDAESAVPLRELLVEEESDDAPRRTWISIEVVQATDTPEQVEVEVTTASGRGVYGRLDTEGRWRCDDLEGAICSLKLLGPPVQRHMRAPRRTPKALTRRDVLWRAGSDTLLKLRSAEHHRVVLVDPPLRYRTSV